MVFSDPIFIFFFLPGLLLAYAAAPGQLKNYVLLCGSLAFYAWDERVWVAVMLASIVFNYTMGCWIGARVGEPSARRLVVLAVAGNLAALVSFKYANFLAANVDVVLASVGAPTIDLAPIHLPIGISFFTFQAISYVVDVYRGEVRAQRKLSSLALYISLFPQLIAGPIVRYHSIADAIDSRVIEVSRFAAGIRRFVIGLGKKMIIANSAGVTADAVFGLSAYELSTPIAWLGVVCYTVQIYYDFSGYSDMAIGLGRMLGFDFCENFNYPYVSRSVTEFWRRWHMSLSSWFRDYVYIPLGGNRAGGVRTLRNLLIVFALCGFWHGASWNFLIWGLLHGLLLILERIGLGRALSSAPALLSRGYVLLVVMVAWVFFRAESLAQSSAFLCAMSGFSEVADYAHPVGFFFGVDTALVLALGCIGAVPAGPWLASRARACMSPAAMAALEACWIALLLSFCAMLMAASAYNPFIYFRF